MYLLGATKTITLQNSFIILNSLVFTNPFVTPEILQLMKTRDNWYKSAIKTNDKQHWNSYQFFRQEVKRETRLAKRIYVRSQIINSKGNTNSMWKVINRCLPKNSPSLPQFNDSHENVANSFNKFASVGRFTALKANQLAKDQNWTLDSNVYATPNIPALSEQFEFQSVRDNDVANVILNLPSNKAPGFDKIQARILKDSLPASLHIITFLMNNSFNSNTFARVWKIAEVSCVTKDGDAGNPCNNRPISLLPVLSKVNGRLTHRQFVKFFGHNNKIPQFQSGNRKHHFTETALLSVTDDLLKAMDEKKMSRLVLKDISKAFDSINHDMLLSKLRSLGVFPTTLEWLKSYLKGRYQYIRIEDVVSQSLPVDYGVPQGSIPGPVLFTFYINDLLTVPS